MNKILTFIAFFTFLVLCTTSLYESNASLLFSSDNSIIAVRSIEKEDRIQEEDTAPAAKEEIDYEAFQLEDYEKY